MRGTWLIGVLVVSLSGCGVVIDRVAHRADAPSPVASPRPTSSAAPTSPAAEMGPTIAQARQALREWVGRYNATLRKRKWWNQNGLLDALFVEAALHEGVIERNHEIFGSRPGHQPIKVTGTPTIYLLRPERQRPIGEWFIAQATYKDTEGHARPHVLAFIRAPGQSFKLAVAAPMHRGRRMPKPRFDADGYITGMDTLAAGAVAHEYQNFWNNEKKEGASGYRLAKDSYSRKAFPAVHKGAYVAFAGHGSIFGFRTADGGSFFLFGMVNDPKHVNQVLSEALLVPQGSRTVQELGADWFS
ncbi:hypothetical protein [Microbispora bryophytorum]|uniref:Uncharacterized protein n=1 Tax=Microbispora bryophytorum TaxID=1460882 RepID=A0A8H9H398_9ACTN|nr:hypothetical protein [Microbispora bryophytorum]MBD3138084.1 hypothetical protein [Microbispora bryophytorum]TQS05291.1 hypothetical protein FLX07_18570 [Microbispora bryophytorum]GGO21875.1 hypothetical protein GCM10011574_49660 [Microbispora bryophytorum]